MAPDVFLRDMIRPGLAELHSIGGPAPSRDAERMLLAIALQESDARHRFQGSPRDIGGPARGWWQFEPIGVQGVLTHRASRSLAEAACHHFHVVPHHQAAWRAIEGHDRLACAFARLLLWTHPRPLPQTAEEGWRQYRYDLWRPGRPHQDRWPGHWRTADGATAHGDDTARDLRPAEVG